MRGQVLRRSRQGVAPVIAELMLVAIMTVMAASAYLMYSVIAEGAANVPTSLTFRSFGTSPASITDTCCLNDTTLDIVTTLGNPQIWAPTIEFTIESTQTGQILVVGYLEAEPTNISDIYLGVYHGSDDEPSIVNIWYNDVDQNGIISISDHISIRGMSRDFHHATFRAFHSGHQLGFQVIP